MLGLKGGAVERKAGGQWAGLNTAQTAELPG